MRTRVFDLGIKELKFKVQVQENFRALNFNFKPGYWLGLTNEGAIVAGSGWEVGGLLFSYHIGKGHNPIPYGWCYDI